MNRFNKYCPRKIPNIVAGENWSITLHSCEIRTPRGAILRVVNAACAVNCRRVSVRQLLHCVVMPAALCRLHASGSQVMSRAELSTEPLTCSLDDKMLPESFFAHSATSCSHGRPFKLHDTFAPCLCPPSVRRLYFNF